MIVIDTEEQQEKADEQLDEDSKKEPTIPQDLSEDVLPFPGQNQDQQEDTEIADTLRALVKVIKDMKK